MLWKFEQFCHALPWLQHWTPCLRFVQSHDRAHLVKKCPFLMWFLILEKWPKWHFKIDLFTVSHSIVQQHVTDWSVSSKFINFNVAVSCGYDTWFAVRLVMDYTTSHFAWSILGISSEIKIIKKVSPYTQKSTISTLAVKFSVSAIFTPRWTATFNMKGITWHWTSLQHLFPWSLYYYHVKGNI